MSPLFLFALFTYATYVMGTVATVKLYCASEPESRRHAAAAFAELHRLDDVFTNYRESELTRLNQAAAQRPVPLSPDMYELVRLSIRYAEKYEGAFDITLGPAVRAWGFLGGPFRVPGREELFQLRERTGMGKLLLDPVRRTLRFRQPGMELDLGGIAKGYAAEAVARLLACRGVERGLVSIGESSLFALGPPPGRTGWPVTVVDPRPPHGPLRVLELPPFFGLSTSGTYGRSFERNGRRYTHLFNPRTGAPTGVLASATVVCASGAESEAAAKAVLLLRRPDLYAVYRWLRLEVRGGVDSRSVPIIQQEGFHELPQRHGRNRLCNPHGAGMARPGSRQKGHRTGRERRG